MARDRIDLRPIYARVARLQTVLDEAAILIAAAAYQPPLKGASDERGYWITRDDDLARLSQSIERAAQHDDGSTDAAGLATLGSSKRKPHAAIPVDVDSVCEIRLPYAPNRELASNRVIRGHFMANGAILKAEKERAIRALADWVQDEPFYTSPVGLDIEIGWGRSLHAGTSQARIAQDRALDWDGVISCLKPMIDAFKEVKLWTDDRLIADGRQRQTIDPSGDGYTTFAIWELDRAVSS